MSEATRRRLVRLVRRPDADLAEAAFLVAAEAAEREDRPDLDVDTALLRVDALADAARTDGVTPTGDPTADARALARTIGEVRGFRGHGPGARVPDDALLDRVLERRRGLPISLSIVYVALARRIGVRAFPIALPGHVVVGVAGSHDPTASGRAVVLDPFGGGSLLDEGAVADIVATATDGRLTFHRAMLRPTPAVDLVRRLLENLTRDYTVAGRVRDALWTVDVKLRLANHLPDDHRVRGRLLEQVGRYDEAADAFERYVDVAGQDAPDLAEVRRDAVRSRARLN